MDGNLQKLEKRLGCIFKRSSTGRGVILQMASVSDGGRQARGERRAFSLEQEWALRQLIGEKMPDQLKLPFIPDTGRCSGGDPSLL